MIAAVLLAAALAVAPLTGPAPAPTPDPSDTACYREAIYCPPPLYGLGQSPTCSYILGRWVTPFGRDCASGSGYRVDGGTDGGCAALDGAAFVRCYTDCGDKYNASSKDAHDGSAFLHCIAGGGPSSNGSGWHCGHRRSAITVDAPACVDDARTFARRVTPRASPPPVTTRAGS